MNPGAPDNAAAAQATSSVPVVSAQVTGSPSGGVSIIVPTYKEAENLPLLIERIDQVRKQHNLTLELLIMDDNSQDGTEQAVAALNKDWVRLIVRTHDRGLSPAVIDGLRAARYDALLVMDADLSHPPEKIPEMLQALAAGNDFVIGSRYVPGGSTDAEWGLFRQLNSRVATLMARPFTKASDPMAGFFALSRQTFARGEHSLNPIGYKIGLELLVKCGCRKVHEVPIHFTDRKLGSSKLSFKEQLRYVQHLRRLFIFRYWTWSHVLQFLVVGASGTVVNLVVLTLLEKLFHTPDRVAIAGGIAVSVVFNFVLNRRFTFSYARQGSLIGQFLGFVAASSLGICVNFFTADFVSSKLAEDNPLRLQIAQAIGIVAGMGLNFVCTRFIIFRHNAVKPSRF